VDKSACPRLIGLVYSHNDYNDIAFKQVIAEDIPLLFVNGHTNDDSERTTPHFTGEVPRLVAPTLRLQTIPTTSQQVPDNLNMVDMFTQFSKLMREEEEKAG